MAKFYVTYGYGTGRKNDYSVIEADTHEKAREEVFRACGQDWAFMYSEEEWYLKERKCNQAEYYGLKEAPLGPHW